MLKTEFLPTQLMWMLSSPIITCTDRVLKLCTFSQKARNSLSFYMHIYMHDLKLKKHQKLCRYDLSKAKCAFPLNILQKNVYFEVFTVLSLDKHKMFHLIPELLNYKS